MNIKNAKILVTGAAGFIGSHLIGELVNRGAAISAADILPVSSMWRINHLSNINILEKFDVADYSCFNNLKGSFDAVFHLAATSNPSFCEKEPAAAFRNNAIGTYNARDILLGLKPEASL